MKQSLIIIDGPMGSGKTTIGKLLHKQLPRTVILSTDAIKWFISDFERGERDNAIAAAVLMQMSKEYIKHGLSILLPQGFWKKENLEPYIKLAEENNLKLFVYQLEAPKEILLSRIAQRPKPELATSPVPQERIVKNLQTWEDNRYQLGKILNTEQLSPEEIVQMIIKDLNDSIVTV
jgi:predicted kinase